MKRVGIAVIASVMALLTLGGGGALAGGWAVTTFDQLPPEFHAGQPYTLGYTIRQHGQTPIQVDDTKVQITANGTTTSFAGKADGALGHYVATVTFPAAGAYRWQVTQGPFAPQELGDVTVLAPSGQSSTPATANDAPGPARMILPFAAVAAAAMFVWRLATIVGRIRRRPAIA